MKYTVSEDGDFLRIIKIALFYKINDFAPFPLPHLNSFPINLYYYNPVCSDTKEVSPL